MPKIDTLFVEFASKGFEELKETIKEARTRFTELGQAVSQIGQKTAESIKQNEGMATTFAKAAEGAQGAGRGMKTAFDGILSGGQKAFGDLANKVKESVGNMAKEIGDFEKLGPRLATSFGALVGIGVVFQGLAQSVLGYVRAGIAAAQIGDQLNYVMQRLNLTLAGLFRPEVEFIISAIRKLTDWIQSWSNQTKEIVAQIVTVTAITSAMAIALGGAALAVLGLNAAFKALIATTTGGILTAIFAITSAMVGLVLGTEEGRNSLGGIAEAFKPLGEAMKSVMTALAPIGAAIWDVLKTIGQIFMDLVSVIGTAISAIAPLLQPLGAAFGALIELINIPLKIIMGIIQAFVEVFSELWSSIGEIIKPIAAAFAWLWNAIGAGLKWLGDLLAGFAKTLIKLLLTPLQMLADLIKTIIDGLKMIGFLKDEDAKRDDKKNDRDALQQKSSGFGSLESFYERIAKESVGMGGGNVQEKQLDELEKISNNTQAMAGAKPAPSPVTK